MLTALLSGLARVVIGRPRTVLLVALLLTSLSVWGTLTYLTTNTDQDDLVSEALPFHHHYKNFLRDFGDQEYLYVMVDARADRPRAQAFVDLFASELAAILDVREVVTRIDPIVWSRQAFFQLSPTQLESAVRLAQHADRPIQRLIQSRTLDDLLHIATQGMASAGAMERNATVIAFRAFADLLSGLRRTAEGETVSAATLFQSFLGKAPVNLDGYLTIGQGQFLLVMIMPDKNYTSLEVIDAPLAKIRAALAHARRMYPDIDAGLTGRPVLSADEMATTNRDMTRATLLALLAITVLLIGYFRALSQPLCAAIALGCGLSWTYGFTTLALGSLNLLSAVFALVLVGGGMEFGLHLIAHFREALASQGDPRRAVTIALTQTGRGNVASALTTASALLCALFTDFQALRELGLIAGIGTILCLTSMLTVLPALLVLRTARVRATTIAEVTLLRPLTQIARRPRIAVGIAGLLLAIAIPGMLRVRMDHNLLNLQSPNLESVIYERRMIEQTDASTWQAVAVADSLHAVDTITARLRALPSVERVESIRALLPTDIDAKQPLIAQLGRLLDATPLPKPAKTINPPALLASLTGLHAALERLANQALQAGDHDALRALEGMMHDIERVRAHMRRGDPAVFARLGAYQSEFMGQLRALLKTGLAGLAATTQNMELPESFRKRFQGASGHYAVYAYPTQNVWDPAQLAAFVRELRSVDPNITGVPVEVYESSRLLDRSFRFVALCALFIIFVIVWIDLRSLRFTVLGMTPLLLGLAWLFGLMGWLGIPITLANFFAIPMLIGLGVDNGVQVLHRMMQDGGYHDGLLEQSTGTGVVLVSLVAVLTFGMLCFGAHRGIVGLGVVMFIGSLTIMLATIAVLPSLLALLRLRIPAAPSHTRATGERDPASRSLHPNPYHRSLP